MYSISKHWNLVKEEEFQKGVVFFSLVFRTCRGDSRDSKIAKI